MLDADGRASFTLVSPHGSAEVALRLHGAHQVSNALAVAATALALGVPVDAVASRLSSATAASRWRMEVSTTSTGVTVVNDAYNANPESVRAALDALAAMGRATTDRGPRRTWAVLGEMRELGAGAETAHEEVGRAAAERGIDHVVAVGEPAPTAWREARRRSEVPPSSRPCRTSTRPSRCCGPRRAPGTSSW